MQVLVAHASRHGSTVGIAERIGDGLRAAGIEADVRPASEVRDVDRYDAFVIGSAAYMFHWLRDATSFVKRNKKVLADAPVWLFSSGPTGDETVDDEGRDVLEESRPKEFDTLAKVIRPRGEKVFFGAWDPDSPPVGLAEKFLQRMPASAREGVPSGDFRDWPAIDAWAAEIAAELGEMQS